MIIGITMIKVVPGHEKASYDAIKEIEGVREIYHLFGEFDFFIVLDALDRVMLNEVVKTIRMQKYVVDTWSLLISKEGSRRSYPGIGTAFSYEGELSVS